MDLHDEQFRFNITKWIFRFGFASIFIVNGIIAIVSPEDFRPLIEENIIGQHFPTGIVDIMIWVIVVNDLVLGALFISGKWRMLMYVWSGLWLLTIAGIKITNLIW